MCLFKRGEEPTGHVLVAVKAHRQIFVSTHGNLEFSEGNTGIILYKDEGRFVLNPLTLTLERL